MKPKNDSLMRLLAFALLLNAALLGVRCSSSSDLSVAEADSPELLARVDALEAGQGELELTLFGIFERLASVEDAIEELQATPQPSDSRPILLAQGLRWELSGNCLNRCPANGQEYHPLEPEGYFIASEREEDGYRLFHGELLEDGRIRFETDRPSTIMLTSSANLSAWKPDFLLDGEVFGAVGSDVVPNQGIVQDFIIPDVPAGEHYLSVRPQYDSFYCFDAEACRTPGPSVLTDGVFNSLVLTLLD